MGEPQPVKNVGSVSVISPTAANESRHCHSVATLSEFDHGGSIADDCADNGVMKVTNG
jgi:hypothetical protein